jgi:hypothetical protein
LFGLEFSSPRKIHCQAMEKHKIQVDEAMFSPSHHSVAMKRRKVEVGVAADLPDSENASAEQGLRSDAFLFMLHLTSVHAKDASQF